MRSEKEMLQLILDFAQEDERILAVTMNGSRADGNGVCDRFSDFDIQYIVRDIVPFLKERQWIDRFGPILILQEPADWFSHPYQPESLEPYPFLMQFTDGNRIDLVFVHVDKLDQFNSDREPRVVLLNKGDLDIREIGPTDLFYVRKPSPKEFSDTVNEFLWLALYVLKGINRRQLCYARDFYDGHLIGLLCTLLSWKTGYLKGFNLSLGKSFKYLDRYLSETERERFSHLFPNGTFEDIYDKLLAAVDCFQETAGFVAEQGGFSLDNSQIENIKGYLRRGKF